ncbi:CCA tRNA nucleotidyltransferase [Paenibacillus arenilitoris]|uniref:CCA tRNA nucleotidyltransferase n=1 Tax=Paenibacillus arenilitoris TaxID=2772299 RepID=A0A927CP46_9BACL|nr:CCA tRNA nucleotidyltransferase [Paenibacillus arenilitoris]MBD2869691.1 CCA tRNA nucleotidyltransferase [Paenibacillus arenilitoris]
MKLSPPEVIAAALPIVTRLREHRFEAVFVGGAVRDTVLGLPVKDVDIATSALPEQVLALFERCIPTGLQHGTVTVVHNKIAYEVTTYREEARYEAHRKPESVRYIASLEGDLLRRDFTMNAMALSADGELIDPYGGLHDLRLGLLRCVGDPNARFAEDALRMLRAVRFIGAYGLKPAYRTWRALLRHGHLMKFIAMERVASELDKLIAGASPARGLHYAAASRLLEHLKEPLPAEVTLAAAEACRTRSTAALFAGLGKLKEADLRLASVAIGLSLTSDAALRSMQALRLSNQRTKSIMGLLGIHLDLQEAEPDPEEHSLRPAWLGIVLRYGVRMAGQWLEIAELLQRTTPARCIVPAAQLEAWMNEMPVATLKQLKVSGKELAEHLRKPTGPWISDWLSRLLLEAALGRVPNDKQPLLRQAELWDKKEESNDES